MGCIYHERGPYRKGPGPSILGEKRNKQVLEEALENHLKGRRIKPILEDGQKAYKG